MSARGTFEVKLCPQAPDDKKGQMLAAMTAVKGSAGAQQLSVTVVPDSGTGELVGLAGKMAIIIADGKHSYDFEYTLAEIA